MLSWERITAKKQNQVNWACESCDRPCPPPDGFHTLIVFPLDGSKENLSPENLRAYCINCYQPFILAQLQKRIKQLRRHRQCQ